MYLRVTIGEHAAGRRARRTRGHSRLRRRSTGLTPATRRSRTVWRRRVRGLPGTRCLGSESGARQGRTAPGVAATRLTRPRLTLGAAWLKPGGARSRHVNPRLRTVDRRQFLP